MKQPSPPKPFQLKMSKTCDVSKWRLSLMKTFPKLIYFSMVELFDLWSYCHYYPNPNFVIIQKPCMKWWLQVKEEGDMELQIMEKMTQFVIALNTIMLRHARSSPLWLCHKFEKIKYWCGYAMIVHIAKRNVSW